MKQDDCYTPSLMPIALAIETMQEKANNIGLIKKTEWVTLNESIDRVLATDIVSALDVPPTDNSAMDGFALRAADLECADTLKLVGKSFAGNGYGKEVGAGECVRIMTGAPIPKGCDTVIMQEQTESSASLVKFLVKKESGNNVRRRGENISQGATVLTRGTRLNSASIALIASLGQVSVEVYRRIKVAVIATGDELAQVGEPLKPGQIYESNRYMLIAMLRQFGADVTDFGIIEDTLEATQSAISKADETCDVIITSGGVSVGDADFVKTALDRLGEIGFWKVAIKPGKPFAFGRLSKSWFCGLPGNPVSSYVTCQQLVLPFLRYIQNELQPQTITFNAVAEHDIKKQIGRTDFQRGIAQQTEYGGWSVSTNGPQGSGIMTSVAYANCYIVFDAEKEGVKKGESVKIIPFSTLIS